MNAPQLPEEQKCFDVEQMRHLVESFTASNATGLEKLLAASHIAMHAAQVFNEQAHQLRCTLGPERARILAITEIAEAISRLQDAAEPAVHGYNEFMRDPENSQAIRPIEL